MAVRGLLYNHATLYVYVYVSYVCTNMYMYVTTYIDQPTRQSDANCTSDCANVGLAVLVGPGCWGYPPGPGAS